MDGGYDSFRILFDVSIQVGSNQIVVIGGPNGSGKSTLLKVIVGQANIFKGRVKFDGTDITDLPTHKIAQQGVVYIPQTENVFAMLSVRENIRMAGYATGVDLQTKIKTALAVFPMIESWLDRKAITLSGGERQILALAMAIEKKPRIILLDEPTAHLAPRIAEQILKKIVELRESLGISIVVVEQNLRKALEYADYAYILTAGRVVFKDKPVALLDSAELGKLFFGEPTIEIPVESDEVE